MKKLLAPLLVVLLVLTACSTSTNNEQTSEQANSNNEGEVKVIKTSISSELDSLDPWQSEASDTEAVMLNVFEGLMFYNEKGDLIPALAKSYQVSEDGLVYTFDLNENVSYHNGDKFDAEDVVYSIDKLAGITSGEPMSSKFKLVESVEKLSDYQVSIKLKEKNAAFLSACIEPILPAGYDDQIKKPVGTGPFKFVSYQPGQKVVLEKNEDYYNPERMAKVDQAEIYIMTEPTAVINALLSGQLDFSSIDPKNVKQLESSFDIVSSPQNAVQIMAMNNREKPFSDVKVRQAISYAINRDQIIASVVNSYGSKLMTNISPAMGEYFDDSLNPYDQDMEKAKQLLADAGYADGFETTVTVPANYQIHVDTAQVIADQLAQLNIKVKIQKVEWGVWLDEVYKQAKYDMTIIGFTGKTDAHDILGRYASDYKKNFMGFKNDKYDQLIKDGRTENDLAKRVAIYKEAGAILNQEAAAVYIMDPHAVVAMSKKLQGYKFYPLRYIDLSSIEYK